MRQLRKFALLSYAPRHNNPFSQEVQKGWHEERSMWAIVRVFVDYLSPEKPSSSLEVEFLRTFDHVFALVHAGTDQNTLSMLGNLPAQNVTLVLCRCNFDEKGNLEEKPQAHIVASGLSEARRIQYNCSGDQWRIMPFLFEGLTRHNISAFLQLLP